MAINVTVTPLWRQGQADVVGGLQPRFNRLAVTGLSVGANTIPHGLPFVPRRIQFRPGAAGLWGETSVPDATNIYVTVGTGGATAGTIDCEE